MNSFLFVFPWAAIGIALAVTAAGAVMGKNVFKKQGVAWLLTIVMVCVAIGVGYAKAPYNQYGHTPEPQPLPTNAPAAASFVWDDANVLSSQTVRTLDGRNERLWRDYSASIGVVTCDNAEDLGEYALKCAGEMGLGGYDFIVALDIAGENYWLLQGNDLRRDFSDQDCSDLAYDCMEKYFAAGDYDNAVLKLTKALEDWYGNYYG